MPRTHRATLLAATLAVSLAPPARATNINYFFVGPDNSLFSSPANWSTSPNGPGGSPPGNFDNPILSPSSSLSVSLDASPNAIPLGTLTLTPAATASLTLNQTATTLSVSNFLFGPRSTYNQLAGNSSATYVLTIDALASSYNLAGGTLVASGLALGASAAGTFTQSTGTANFNGPNGNLRVGGQGPAIVSLSDGSLSAGYATVDSLLSASVSQTGGTHTLSSTLLLGQNASYSLSAGSLLVAGPFYVGGKAAYPSGTPAITADAGATFSQTGGSVTLSSFFTLDRNSNPGSDALYSISAGSLTFKTNADLTVGLTRAATFLQTGTAAVGSASAYPTNTYLAKNAGSSAAYTLANNAQLFADRLRVGYSGSASFTQTGGTLSLVGSSPALSLADNAGSSAYYSLSAGTITGPATLTVGGAGSATFAQSGGSVGTATNPLNDFSLGSPPSGVTPPAGVTSYYSLSGSGALRASTQTLGAGTPASFAQSGGTNSASTLSIASSLASPASYSLSAGSLTVQGTLQIGFQSPGTFTQTGGAASARSFSLSGGFSNPSTLNLSAGTFTLTSPSDNYVGNGGPSFINQTGGTFAAPTAYIHLGYTNSAGSIGAYSLSGTGVLSARYFYVGELGAATFSQAGGSSSFNTLFAGSPPTTGSTPASVACSLSAGTLTAAYLKVHRNFYQTGGSASVSSSLDIGAFPSSNGLYSLSGAGSLSAPLVNVAPVGAGTLLQSGGTLTTTALNLTIPAHFTLSAGTLTVTSTTTNNSFYFSQSGGSSSLAAVTGTGYMTLTNTASLIASSLRQYTLSLANAASATLLSPVTSSTLNSLTLADSSTLDLTANTLTLSHGTSSPAPTIRGYLLNNRLTSSAADPTHRLGYLDTPTLLTIRLTPTGDANLDGKLTPDDFALLDRGYAKHLTTWQDGDFNYDGMINNQDYLLIDQTLYSQAQHFSPGFLATRESQFGAGYVSTLLASVPEPTSAIACLFAVLPLTRRPNEPAPKGCPR